MNTPALALGFTRRIEATDGYYCLDLLVKPGDYLDGSFRAWCCDEREFLTVSGWLFEINEVTDSAA